MMEFVILLAAIVLGTLLSTLIMIVVICNKAVMKKYLKWITRVTDEIANELFVKQD